MRNRILTSHYYQAGFSLIEILVGMLIGMIGIIVMMQVFSVAEARKRTATAGSDAQNNAVIALDGIQRDITQAGYGFSGLRVLGCNLQLPSAATVPLAPVIINPPTTVVPAGDTNTDTLLVAYGDGEGQPEGTLINSQSGTVYSISSPGLITLNDRVFASPDACGVTTLILSSVQAVGVSSVTLANSQAGTALFNLGKVPRFRAYAIRDGNLTMCDFMVDNCSATKASLTATQWAARWVPLASNVVGMRAQYGRDTAAAGSMDGIVDLYDQTTPTTACGWVRTSAVRLALVARSAQFEKDVVTANAPTWAGSDDAPLDLSKNPDGSLNTLWGNYRYRVYETLMPVRNISWMGVQSGC